jgi:hypothetical protein
MSSEAARPADLGGQLKLETSVLRTLCLTVNSDGSELKYEVLEKLQEGDFYFPVTRTIFSAVTEMNREGDHVVASALTDVLKEKSVDVPDDFYVDDLFKGELPSVATLSKWIDLVKSGREKVPHSEHSPSAYGQPTKARSLQKTHPVVQAGHAVPEDAPVQSVSKDPPPPPSPARIPESLEEPPASFEKPPADAMPSDDGILTPESGQWLGFLADLTKKQAERLKTGFSRIDSDWGGLGPGLLLLAGERREQLLDFLKQLVDQVAAECRGPCLYVSFERSKAALRLQTLSRLSGASAADIEKGTFGKDSAKWQDIVRAGEHAVEWLQRIYVVEARAGLAVTRIRELRQGLLDSGAGAPRLIAIDNIEKLANQNDLLQSVAELKELAEAFGVVVVGAATAMDLVHERSADMAASFHDEGGQAVVKISSSPKAAPTVLRFDHRSETHRFEERGAA